MRLGLGREVGPEIRAQDVSLQQDALGVVLGPEERASDFLSILHHCRALS